MKREDFYLTIALSILVAICGLSYWFGLFLPQLAKITKDEGYVEWLGFFGNMVGAAGTLIAAAIAWAAVQQQISTQREVTERNQLEAKQASLQAAADAKTAAVIILNQLVRVAGGICGRMRMILRDDGIMRERGIGAVERERRAQYWVDDIDRDYGHLGALLAHFTVEQGWSGLAVDDRTGYLRIIDTLYTAHSTYNMSQPFVNYDRRLSFYEMQTRSVHRTTEVRARHFDPSLGDTFLELDAATAQVSIVPAANADARST